MTETIDVAELRERVEAAGQEHLFRCWKELDGEGRARLARQLADLDLELVRELAGHLDDPPSAPAARFDPPEVFATEREAEQRARAREAEQRGEELLAAGRVGYLLVAGGQGSRLGFDGPKGAFTVGPVSERTLFGWHAARIAAARARYGATFAWYVMTSVANHAATLAAFEEHDYFGLGPENVVLFPQGMLPALDADGRVLLGSPDALFLAPDGHGGALAALATSGALEHARERGIDVFCSFQVDNPLVRQADPLFLGLHSSAGAEMSSKVVGKRDAGEKVGVIGRADGRLGCIEYSDLPDELRHAQDEHGALLFRAGNIACHLIERTFVERLTAGGSLRLPWHLARKKVKTIDEAGRPVERVGVKFETFIFDALGEARNSVTLEVERSLEFSPVKNAAGEDSPASCRADLGRLFAGWVRDAGGSLPAPGADGEPPVEIDPRVAEDREAFLKRWPLKPRELGGGHLYTP